MTSALAQQQQQHPAHSNPNATLFASQQAPTFASSSSWSASHLDMESSSHFESGALQQYQQHSSPAGPSTVRSASANAEMSDAADHYLPPQIFSSSPTERSLYPQSTMAAVEATRARFFAQQSASASRSRSRPTATGSTSASSSTSRNRTHKAHPLSSSSSSSYRQSFFERCQRAMDTARSVQRSERVSAFRKGADGFTRELFSDDMDEDDDASSNAVPSSPPAMGQWAGEEREEDDELTRRRIIAEYSRLKRIYELKGHLEIGWIDPDQLSWLEGEMRQQQQQGEPESVADDGGVYDPYWMADDEQLEQLWIESQQQHQQQQQHMMEEDGQASMMVDEFDQDDAGFEEALARLPV